MGKKVAPATGLGSFKTLVEPSGVATGLPPRTFHLPEGPVGLPPFWLRVDSRRPVHPVRARNSYGQPCETHIPTASQKIYLDKLHHVFFRHTHHQFWCQPPKKKHSRSWIYAKALWTFFFSASSSVSSFKSLRLGPRHCHAIRLNWPLALLPMRDPIHQFKSSQRCVSKPSSLSHRLLCEVIFGCLDHADHLPWMIVAKCLTRPCRPMAPFDTIYYLFVICLHVISLFFVFVFFYSLICIFCCSNASRKLHVISCDKSAKMPRSAVVLTVDVLCQTLKVSTWKLWAVTVEVQNCSNQMVNCSNNQRSVFTMVIGNCFVTVLVHYYTLLLQSWRIAGNNTTIRNSVYIYIYTVIFSVISYLV